MPCLWYIFRLLAHTKVSKCYGCDGHIQNPPIQRPDDLVIFRCDIREYLDRITGKQMKSSSPQNVHFHLNQECVLKRYPGYHPSLLVVGHEILPFLQQEHIHRLSTHFGWNNSM
jgi:hypothetical protein